MTTNPLARFHGTRLLAPLLLAIASACSSSQTHPPVQSNENGDPPTDAGLVTLPNGNVVCPPAQGACNTQGTCGVGIYVTQVPGDPPTPTGGTVAAGTYVLTSYTNYSSPGGPQGDLSIWFQDTFTLTVESDAGVVPGANVFQYDDALATNQGTGGGQTSGTWTLTQTSVTSDYTCSPGGSGGTGGYSATQDTFMAFVPQPYLGGTSVLQYTRLK